MVRVPKLDNDGTCPCHCPTSKPPFPYRLLTERDLVVSCLSSHPAPLQEAGAHLSVTHYDQADKSDVHVGPQRFIVVNLIHLQGEQYKGSKFSLRAPTACYTSGQDLTYGTVSPLHDLIQQDFSFPIYQVRKLRPREVMTCPRTHGWDSNPRH